MTADLLLIEKRLTRLETKMNIIGYLAGASFIFLLSLLAMAISRLGVI